MQFERIPKVGASTGDACLQKGAEAVLKTQNNNKSCYHYISPTEFRSLIGTLKKDTSKAEVNSVKATTFLKTFSSKKNLKNSSLIKLDANYPVSPIGQPYLFIAPVDGVDLDDPSTNVGTNNSK